MASASEVPGLAVWAVESAGAGVEFCGGVSIFFGVVVFCVFFGLIDVKKKSMTGAGHRHTQIAVTGGHYRGELYCRFQGSYRMVRFWFDEFQE
jgi:hypothetical protein